MRPSLGKLSLLIVLLALQTVVNAQTTYYVDANNAQGNGSLANPFTTVYEACLVATTGLDTILITADVYSITATLNFSKDIVIKGGYNSTFTSQIGYSILDGGIAHPLLGVLHIQAFYLRNLSNKSSIDHLVVKNVTEVSVHGAAMYVDNSFLRLSDMKFLNNEANNDGGAIYIKESNLELNNVSFIENKSKINGGGICGESCIFDFKNVEFIGNVSDAYGGGIYTKPISTSSSANIINGSFVRNEAPYGGAYSAIHSIISFTNTLFFENFSTIFGGAMYNYVSYANFINVSFINNETLGVGGGIFSHECRENYFNNSVFFGNHKNNVISDIYIYGVSGNGVPIDLSSSHNASDGMGGLDNVNPSSFIDLSTYSFNDIFNDTNYLGLDSNNRTFDDGLIPIVNSPLVNAGENSYNLELFDLALNNRIYNSYVDIGAYEFCNYISCFEEYDKTDILIFPNPTADYIKIISEDATEIEIYNLSGSKIETVIINSIIQEIDLSNYPSNIYLIRVLKGNNVIGTQKVIKQ